MDIIPDTVVLAARAAAAEEMSQWRIMEIQPKRTGGSISFLVDDEPRYQSKAIRNTDGSPAIVALPDTQIMQAECPSYEVAQRFVSHQTWRRAIAVAISKLEEERADDGTN